MESFLCVRLGGVLGVPRLQQRMGCWQRRPLTLAPW